MSPISRLSRRHLHAVIGHKLPGECQILRLCIYRCPSFRISPKPHVQTHTHTHPFNGPFSGTTRGSRYQKGITNLDFTEARDSEWQWHQLDHMQVCILLQTDNHASTSSLSFLQAGCPSCRPTNSVKALKAPNVRTSANILCMLPTATARSSSDEAQQILYRSGIGV